jgi:hypothetical protein
MLLVAVAFGVFVLTAARSTVSIDVWSAHFAAWHLAHTGSPWIDGTPVPILDNNPLREQFVRETVTGHLAITRSAGVVAAGVPAYWLAGTATPTEWPGGATAALLMAFSVLFVFLALERSVPRRTAVLAAAAFGFATPVWSVAANGIWPHTVTVFGITGMAWASSRRRWWLVGLFGGVALWGRVHAALIVAIVGVLLGWWRRDVGIVVRIAIVSGTFLLGLCAWNHWTYGTWSPSAAYETSMFTGYARTHGVSLGNQLGMWFAPNRGIFVWTPALLLLVPALVRSWKTLPDWSRALVWAGLAYTIAQGVLDDYDGGFGFYGYRLGLEMVACLTPAAVLAAPRAGRVARRLLGPALALQACAITIGAVVDNANLLQPQSSWHDNEFVGLMVDAGLVAWSLLLALCLLAVWAQRVWVSTVPPAHERGTVSSHSVP